MNRNLKERIVVLQNEQLQAKARLQQLRSRENKEERKNSDRRKYVLGALVLRDIETSPAFRNYIIKLLSSASERDKKPFTDLLTGTPATASN